MQRPVRCEICRKHVPTVKNLKHHYKATPSLLARKDRKKKPNDQRSVYLHDNLHITYSSETIIIKNEGDGDHLVEVTFDGSQNLPAKETNNNVTTKKTSKRAKKSKKPVQIGIRKVVDEPKSLDEHTGEFYECHCMEKATPKTSSDTESCSDAGRNFYCNSCGNGYSSNQELIEHEKIHMFLCRICNQTFNFQSYREHFEQHIIRIYVCHFCGFEFIAKNALIGHLDYHFEQQTFEGVLDMERNYNLGGSHNAFFSSGNYSYDVNNILMFLTYPHDQYMFRKIRCDICFQDLYVIDYERHLKIVHYMH